MIRFFRTATRLAGILLTVSCSLLTAQAQAPKTYTSSEILLGLKKLNVLGSVLYIAAHPDDENTRLLAYLANERLVETAYLSCTRGDGGQNLIGPELREQLGVIRTQELLAARRIDGAKQFFTRANDFGFSKTAEETFTIWDKEQVLADMVWVIRQRRPDVLITRFPPDSRAGHGHHTASAMLAIEAFSAAGDAKRFPEQLQYVQPWQPKRLLWNTGSFFVKPGDDLSKFLKLDAGGYNPLLGQSYGEIAARSRSQHRSQGFGSAAQRGELLEYFTPIREGDALPKELFEGVDMSWNRVPGGAAVGKLIDDVIKKFDPSKPEGSVAGLLKVRELLAGLINKSDRNQAGRYSWYGQKLAELDKLIVASLGVHIEAVAAEPMVSPGQKLDLRFEALNRSNTPVRVGAISLGYADTTLNTQLTKNKLLSVKRQLRIPVEYKLTQPYWLSEPSTTGMYGVSEQLMRGVADNSMWRNGVVGLGVAGQELFVDFSIQYKHTDPSLGELYQPLVIVPPVVVNLPAARAYVFSNLFAQVSGGRGQQVPVMLRAGRAGVSGTLALQVPGGWHVEPASVPFSLKNKDEEQTIDFKVIPTNATEGRTELKAVATVDGQAYSRGMQQIVYPHIPTQTLFPEATSPLVKLDVSRGKTQTVGYLMGAGDEVPEALRQLGYTVTLLDANTDLSLDKLRRFDAVVLGIRAYNTLDQLKAKQPELLRYVEQGGNLVVQYTVARGTVIPEIGPYPMKLSNDRVTVENAPVTFLQPQHRLLNAPNKISAADFQGWVQEQGLYYPSTWDAKYTPIISSADPGEKAKESAILVADYGKGHYIYTGLSFFRELPAGIPGAYRLLANLVSYGK
ncbi:PIG-L family deacetylase [Hymenobacter saemangeumensis]|uniref:PIG-L family deacetylase n=1 Tax=Hymenobacter saemangeumensis TaxID=1084522 RepID=A0ABP8IRY4_9BACT